MAQGAALGFSHLLLSAPGNHAVTASAKIDCGERPQQQKILEQLGRHCDVHGLALLFDWAPDGEAHRLAADTVPIPSSEAELAKHVDQLAVWADAGVAGFRCSRLASRPAAYWRQLLADTRARAGRILHFLAWTPGLSPAQLQALSGCGFDAVFSSLPWWDFQSPWLAEEQQRLRALGAVLINPLADLVGVRPRAEQKLEPCLDLARARRLLQCAAACGDGWLLPTSFAGGLDGHDLTPDIVNANQWVFQHSHPATGLPLALQMLSGADASLTLLARTAVSTPSVPDDTAAPLVIAINRSLTATTHYPVEHILAALAMRTGAAGLIACPDLISSDKAEPLPQHYGPLDQLQLPPAAVSVYRVAAALPAPLPAQPQAHRRKLDQANLEAALRAPRIVIENVQPAVDAGRFAVKRVVGESVTVEADVWIDGHDLLGVAVCWRTAGASHWQEAPMLALGNDRWRGVFALEQLGNYEFTVQAWHDPFATWLDELAKKRGAGLDLTLEIEEGRLLARRIVAAATGTDAPVKLAQALKRLAAALGEMPAATAEQRVALLQLLLAPATLATLAASGYRPFKVWREPGYPLAAERLAARFGSWYELFPRSQTDDPARHGNFDDVIERLPAIRAMGFDVLYFPPIHPIGLTHRKGRNNSLNAAPGLPGSPYAIGAAEGGHEALHAQLGSFDDFRRLLDAVAAQGMEFALDFAIQCSPDHPWLRDHPEWFSYRPDGTLRYAENPPKKYEDIVNVDFYQGAQASTDESRTDSAEGLWRALRDIVLFWAERGVRIFRVDNPHTKPLPFWEWLIAEVRHRYPDTIFLAEAFTRPKPMARLAKLGFSQSYTYFIWRQDKRELTDYLTELTTSPLREYFRPHFFVNTPDINPYFLHRSGRPGFLIRAALASLLSGLWGMLAGYELCEAAPLVVDGRIREEYADSDKFEIRPRDWQQSGNIIAEITRLNSLRRNYPALRNNLGLRFYYASNEQVLYFARYTEPPMVAGVAAQNPPRGFGDSVLLVAINLDPFHTQRASIELPLWEWGLPDDAALQVEDLMQGQRFVWYGKIQQIALNPQQLPFSVWQVSPLTASGVEGL